MNNLAPFLANQWHQFFSLEEQTKAVTALESGQILFFPNLTFNLEATESYLLAPTLTQSNSKNISFNMHTSKLGGCQALESTQIDIKTMLLRFIAHSRALIDNLLPIYTSSLLMGRTSFRPVEISGRKSPSYRKDDSRLHVDAFPSTPTQGQRILRLFTNINPDNIPRVWRVGEHFTTVANRFIPKISPPIPGSRKILALAKVTRQYRTLYDHYMLNLHNRMKANEIYQKKVNAETIHFPAGSTWIVCTDAVSHAALSGQHVLEQTFYLPVNSMQNNALSPFQVLSQLLQKNLLQ